MQVLKCSLSSGGGLHGEHGYRDQELYAESGPSYAGRAGPGYTLYPGPANTGGLSVDLPSPDSGIGPDQVIQRAGSICVLVAALSLLLCDVPLLWKITFPGMWCAVHSMLYVSKLF